MPITPIILPITEAATLVREQGGLLVGLIGAGIQRSLSPRLHEEEARHHGLRLHYRLIDLDELDAGARSLPLLLAAARDAGFAGVNVTYPCKQAVLPLLDEVSDEAAAMGAVNTVVFREGRSIGHNTDGSGWTWGFRRALPNAALGRIALLGAGGAGSAIAHALLRMGARHLAMFDSDSARTTALAKELARHYGAGRAEVASDPAAALAGAVGLVHATPTGMDKLPGLPLPESLLHAGLWVSEIVYFPFETALLRAARARGCTTIDGGTMAVGQALGAFALFTGRKADAERVEAHLRRLLIERGAA